MKMKKPYDVPTIQVYEVQIKNKIAAFCDDEEEEDYEDFLSGAY